MADSQRWSDTAGEGTLPAPVTAASGSAGATRRILRTVGIAAGIGVAVASAAAVFEARRTRARVNRHLDALLGCPEHVRHHHVATSDGARIHVVEQLPPSGQASGRPVLLLHGVTLQWWVWNSLFHLLGEDHRVFAWDMRGHGASTVGERGMTLEAVADDIAAVIDEFDLVDPVIVGHSMGGMALLNFCLQHRQHLDASNIALVLVATSGDILHNRIDQLFRPIVERVFAHKAASSDVMSHPDVGLALTRVAFGQSPSGDAVEQVRQMGAEMSSEHLAGAIHSITGHDTNSRLSGVRNRAAIVVGSRDALTPPFHSRRLVRSFETADLHLLAGIGHQVMQEDPETLALIITDLAASERDVTPDESVISAS